MTKKAATLGVPTAGLLLWMLSQLWTLHERVVFLEARQEYRFGKLTPEEKAAIKPPEAP